MVVLTALGAAVMAGLGTFGAFDVTLSDTFTVAGGTFSLAYLLQIGAFGWTVVTNDHDLDPSAFADQARSELTDYYYYTLIAAIIVLVLWPFVSDISSFIQSKDLWGVVFIIGSVAAQMAIGWMR
jgi:hypothetical protein